MRIGLYFNVDSEYIDSVWPQLIGALLSAGDVWSVDCLDCLYDDSALSEASYTPETLVDALKTHSGICFARMMCASGAKVNGEIRTYGDYLISSCHAIVFCVDCGCFEVYAKRSELLDNVIACLPTEWIDNLEPADDSPVDRTEFIL